MGDVTFPGLSFSSYRNTLVIGWFINHCPAKRSLIGWCICGAYVAIHSRSANGGVFHVRTFNCMVSVCGRRQKTENECIRCDDTDILLNLLLHVEQLNLYIGKNFRWLSDMLHWVHIYISLQIILLIQSGQKNITDIFVPDDRFIISGQQTSACS